MSRRIVFPIVFGVIALISLGTGLAALAANAAGQTTISNADPAHQPAPYSNAFRLPRANSTIPRSGRPDLANDNVVVDGGFEAGSPNPNWAEESTNFGTPICDENCFQTPAPGAHGGDFWAWFGGVSGGYEAGSLSQSVTIPTGSASLSFWLMVPVCDNPDDYLEAQLDGTQVFVVDGESDLCEGTSYAQHTVNVSAWADGGSHTLTFTSETNSTNGGPTNFFVDDVRLDATTGQQTATPTPTRTPTSTPTPTTTATLGPSPTPTATATGGPPPVAGPGILLSEVMAYPASGNPEWVELQNYDSSPHSLRGHSLRDEDGHIYRFPQALPDVPPGARVVVLFDGQGSGGDDLNFGDGRATLHSPPGMTGVLEDNGDQVALYRTSAELNLPVVLMRFAGTSQTIPRPNTANPPQLVTSFVAWGNDPGGDAGAAVYSGVWPPETYVDTNPEPGPERLLRGGVIGRRPGRYAMSPSDWAVYRPGDGSQGTRNLPAAPFVRNPTDGIALCDRRVTFGWESIQSITSYQFQIDNDSGFGSPLVNVSPVTSFYKPGADLPLGELFFRVRVLGGANGDSAWSPVHSVTILNCTSLLSVNGTETFSLLPITPKLQHKDTHTLNLDGDPETGQSRWDSSHENDGDWTIGNGTPVRVSPLDNMYCTRAAISMIVAYFGGNLSMDHISFFYYGGGEPEGDLGHGKGMWPNGNLAAGTGKKAFNWAMNDNAVTSSRGKPTFAQVKTWIDENRPMLIVENSDAHSVVLNGYNTEGELVYRTDPWTGTGGWVSLATWSISEYHVPPNLTPPLIARSDPDTNANGISDLNDDTDNDGISDFDEAHRFKGKLRNLNPRSADSDGDGITDKADMRAHVFDNGGNYSRLRADWDSDGDRKETDPDNDNYWDTGSSDGCEDMNRNGIFNPPDETSNFNPAEEQERECEAPEVDITSPGGTISECVYTLAGTITSDADLTEVNAIITGGSGNNVLALTTTGTKPNFTFNQQVPVFSGDNVVQITAANEYGIGNDFVNVKCGGDQLDIHVQLTWPQLGSDFDLHLIRPGGAYWAIPDDCHWRNRSPDWGVSGVTSDNPTLDVDCITSCTIENIILPDAFNGTYTIKVHYYSDRGLGPSSPRVRIWVRGQLFDYGPQSMSNGQVWDVATVNWENGTVTVINQVRERYPGEVFAGKR